jgi:hypothetical protein
VPVRSVALLVALTVAACSDGSPLGGPYGGTSDPTGPNGSHPNGQPTDSDGGTVVNTDPDSGTTTTGKDGSTSSGADSSTSSTTPTWTQIWTDYLAVGKAGNCASGGCHSQMASKSAAYSWLQGRGYISGTSSSLVSSSSSCLTWYGGNMPPLGPGSLSAASKDMDAWVAAGAANN